MSVFSDVWDCVADLFDEWSEMVVYCAVIAVIVALTIWLRVDDEKRWARYAAQHHCRQVGTKEANSSLGIGSNGKSVVVFNPEQTIYNCDGGELRIR